MKKLYAGKRSKVLTGVNIKVMVPWDGKISSLVHGY